MKRRSVFLSAGAIALALAVASPAAVAQDDDAPYYDGTWAVQLKCSAGVTCPTRIVLQEFEGTWQDLSGSKASKHACSKRKMPITIQASTRSVLAFTAWGDGVSKACPNYTIVVKPAGDKVLAGTADTEGDADESPEVHAAHAPASGAATTTDGQPVPSHSATARPIRLVKRR